jgi:hypothetical protein
MAILTLFGAAGAAGVAAAGAYAGTSGAAAASFAIAVLLLSTQGIVARAVAPLAVRLPSPDERAMVVANGIDPDRVRVVESNDEAFTGGWIGPLGAPQLWMPSHWMTSGELPVVQCYRRLVQLRSGDRTRGWLRAAAWPAPGILLVVPLLPWSWQDARLWIALPAIASLWSFVAVLLLPSLTRPATNRADAAAAHALGAERVSRVIDRLDAWQDDEPERSPWVERVFHPVPSAGNRRRAIAIGVPPARAGGHQQTRLTLFASLATGSLLGRMVHCNIGRPALWVAYPGD